jgi:hypothetical protein
VQFRNITARLGLALAALLLASAAAAPARAQEEAPPVVLDEPIAQVDNYVIMLSQLKRENSEFREVLTKQRGMTPEQAQAEIDKRLPEIILNLINEALLVQKGKDMPRMTEDIEAEVNREVLRVAKQSQIATIEELEEAMRREGMSLSDIKDTLRRQFMRQAVLQREVDAKIYYGLTDKELREYYDKNRDKFVSVTLSELYLSLAGRTEAEVKAKAADLEVQGAARGQRRQGALVRRRGAVERHRRRGQGPEGGRRQRPRQGRRGLHDRPRQRARRLLQGEFRPRRDDAGALREGARQLPPHAPQGRLHQARRELQGDHPARPRQGQVGDGHRRRRRRRAARGQEGQGEEAVRIREP